MILYMYYQVETVGQVYMLVSGAPERRPDHAQNVARAALDMVNAVERLSTTYGGEKVMVRIGMCSCLWCSQFTGTKLKAGPKCPSIEAKYSKAVLKFIFLTKVNKICKHDYSSRNIMRKNNVLSSNKRSNKLHTAVSVAFISAATFITLH